MHPRRIFAVCLLALSLTVTPGPVADVILGPLPPDDRTSWSPFLLKRTDARVVVTGPVAHAVVTQTWENPNTVPVDGLYIFPLPENAAVTDMSLRIGDRLIKGEMKRREEARALYDKARSEGRVAGLLDQERPNIFAQRVANIVPGARVEVVLAFDHEIRCEEEDCEYVFPTVVGPRFIPCRQADPGAIDPPVVAQGRNTGQALALTVDLEGGVSFRDLRSPSHKVTVTNEGAGRARVVLAADEAALLNRDVRLAWRVGGPAPEVGLVAWRDPRLKDEPGVFALIIQPQADPTDDEAAAREIVFVLDCSGSMSGMPIEAAKNVVRKALPALRPKDTFQIIRFSERASGLGPEPLPATPENVRRALAYLEGLRGEGGTEMISGIRAALDRPADPERLRIVAFLTDGYIGNEREILGEVRRLIGGARLFSFGIGSSVNRYLLEDLAEEGRGQAAFLGTRETPDQMVERFVGRIATPVLTDIRITFEDLDVGDIEPAGIPDLFAGQPLVIHGRYRKPGTGVVLVEGRRRGRAETLRRVAVLPDQAADHEALGRLWARARIHRLSRDLYDGDRPEVVAAITDLGLRLHLMTPYTSLVAVDSLVSNATGSSATVNVPVEMPEDVSYEGIFGHDGGAVMRQAVASPAPSTIERLRALGYAGGYAGGVPLMQGAGAAEAPGEADRKKSASRPDTPGKPAPSFTRLTLVLPDGRSLVVEPDGEVWRIESRARTLVRALTPSEMEALGKAVAAAGSARWGGAASGPRLVLELTGTQKVAGLPAADPAIDRLARLIEGWGR